MKVKRDVIEFALEIAKESYPNEFVALLTGKKGIVEELVFLPFLSGERSAVIRMEMLPLGYRIYGTVHSHPTPNCTPSPQDVHMFMKYGSIHIIVCYPFDEDSWVCYDKSGNPIDIEVID